MRGNNCRKTHRAKAGGSKKDRERWGAILCGTSRMSLRFAICLHSSCFVSSQVCHSQYPYVFWANEKWEYIVYSIRNCMFYWNLICFIWPACSNMFSLCAWIEKTVELWQLHTNWKKVGKNGGNVGKMGNKKCIESVGFMLYLNKIFV